MYEEKIFFGGKTFMLNKKIAVPALIILCLLAISSVSASEISDDASDLLGNDNEVLKGNSDGTFTDLANEIVNATGELSLTRNYVYSDDDSDYKDGIIIDKAINIDGNGFTVNGNNQSRIFYIVSSNVVLNDICFMNSYSSSSGGAIYGGCSAVNCTFIGNSAGSNGGAMSGKGSSAVNCTFRGNSASSDGGAMYQGSAFNCTFMGNSAGYGGGAMSSGSAFNCNFVDNPARYGGAVSSGYAVNCTFTGNSAWDFGGAMSGKSSSAVNCTFRGNSARDYGGAMAYVSSAVNCTFMGNSAINYGGAIYDGSAVDCTFVNNSAINYGGGAIFSGYAENCTFVNDDVVGVETVNCTFIPAATVITAQDLTTVYGVSKKLIITLMDSEGNVLSGAQISVLLNNKSYNEFTDSNGEASITIPDDLNPNNYKATISYAGDSEYLPSDTTANIAVNKAAVDISATADNNEIIATLTNEATGKPITNADVQVNVNGATTTVKSNTKGQVKVSTADLPFGKYIATVSYEGDDKYDPSNTTVDIVVSRIPTAVSAVYDADASSLVATLVNGATGQPILGATVSFKINNAAYKVSTDNNGHARLSTKDLPLGTYDGTVSYGGNSKYNPSSASLSIPVRANTSFDVVYYAGDKTLIATLVNGGSGQVIKGATVAVVLNNVRSTLKTDVNGQVKVSTKDLNSGVYPVVVSYAGNSKYNPAKTTLDIVIGVKTSISAVYKNGILTATLTDKATGKGINGADILVSFGDANYTVKTNSNGQANASTKDLTPGAYAATVSYNGVGDTSSNTSIPIEVKVHAYFIVEDVSLEYNANSELVATLVNYATGKGIVGASVGFKINGKSYAAKTDANGQAKVNLPGLNPGTYNTVVSYNGNAKYNPAKETFDVVVNKITTSISVYYDSQNNEVVATLINEATGGTVKGGTIGIFLNNVKHIIVTDMGGQVRLSLGDVDSTSFTAYVTYAGNTKYLASTRTLTPLENKIESYISTAYNKETNEVVSTLINKATGKGVVGGTVNIVVNNIRNNIKTDAKGQAKVSIADLTPNVYKVVGSYAGNTKYTATTETIYIVKT
ncbi:hypothetical protein [Methanobrevibacter sp.]|uniref:hypothetical protein n=1 Tax=Methanobrevibacter sp. TaxID=66852 RepID=UPI0038707B6B